MDRKAAFVRTLILGNSGSGKSRLSKRLAATLETDVIDLDGFHWEPGSYGRARDKGVCLEMTRQSASRPRWVIEGVYGWLALEVVSNATALILIDIPVNECIANLRQRGLRGGGDEAAFRALIAWAADYPYRQTSSSRAGHERIFGRFPHRKLRISSREEMDLFLTSVHGLDIDID
jgi:energy-coupling factor transporter ATP-binding protein EcfA2